MSVMRQDDPIYFAKYAHDNDLIYKTGWKQLRWYVKKTKKMNRLPNNSKAKQKSNTVKI